MRRRDFLCALGGVAAAWPFAARAQQADRIRRIGVLMLYPENDPQGQLRATAFQQGLQQLGWVVGRNVQIDFQWGFGDADWLRSAAAQLLRLAPDVIVANGTPAAKTMQQASRTVPVIFIAGSDPIVDGLVPSLAHPGGNLTGFYGFEPSFGSASPLSGSHRLLRWSTTSCAERSTNALTPAVGCRRVASPTSSRQ